jgi:DNA-binding response OmpR family regulator
MKEEKVLLLDVDGDCESIAAEAAARHNRTVRMVKTIREAFKLVRDKGAQLDAIILDVDPGAHGLALLEAISGCADKPPMIVITSLEENYMKAIAAEHGAMACFAKPITTQILSVTLGNVMGRSRKCDRWGYLVPSTCSDSVDVRLCVRGIAQKLAPA